MATRIKSKSKIGRRIARRAKAGKGVELGLGPGAASLVGKSAATKLAALAKRISAAKKAKAKLKPKKKMIKVSVKGPISSTITDAGTKAAVAARKAKRAALQAKMDKSNAQAVKLKAEIAAKKDKFTPFQRRMMNRSRDEPKAIKGPGASKSSRARANQDPKPESAATKRADLVRRSNAQADRLAGKKPPRQPTTGMPARQSSGSGFNPKAAAEARKTPAKRALEARQRAQRNR